MTTRSTIPVQNITTCVICRQHFDDPRMLPCLHTYCLRCIQEGIMSNNGHFECPLRDGTKVDEKSIDSLPSNRIARDIVELLSPIQCSNCYVKTADHWCDKCGNDYCSNCSAIVHAPPALKNHRIVAIGDKCPEIASCDTHTDERLKYWCHACDTLVCRDCLLFEHKEHKSALMDQVAKQLKSQIDTSLSSIQTLLDGRVNQMKTLITRIDNAKTLNKTKVTEAMACLRRTIDEHERAVLNEISEIETGQKKQIEEYRIQLQGEQDNLDTQKSNFSIVLSIKDHTKLLQTKPDFVGYAERTNEVLNGLEPPSLINYHAEGLYQLQGLQEKVYQCGQLVQSSTYNNPKLEKQIADIKENALLQLNDQQLNDQDMEIIANALKKN